MAAPLYIKMNISGRDIPALIDTGAQVTLMSLEFCQNLGISGSIDSRFPSNLNGVGSKFLVLGRIEELAADIVGYEIFMSVQIVDSENIGFLMGLDSLKKFGCV